MIRRIFVSDLSEIDFDNFGVHFSENHHYEHNGGGSNGLTKVARYNVRVTIETASINEAATAISRENFPREREVVLDFNQILPATLNVIDLESGDFAVFNREITINTGTRCDKWVENL